MLPEAEDDHGSERWESGVLKVSGSLRLGTGGERDRAAVGAKRFGRGLVPKVIDVGGVRHNWFTLVAL